MSNDLLKVHTAKKRQALDSSPYTQLLLVQDSLCISEKFAQASNLR